MLQFFFIINATELVIFLQMQQRESSKAKQYHVGLSMVLMQAVIWLCID